MFVPKLFPSFGVMRGVGLCLPPRAEYLEAHGMIDMVVKRQDMRATLARLCALLTRTQPIEHAA